jgi:hypothetical protein
MCPPVVNSIFIAVKKSRKAKDIGGPIEFIDQQDTKKIINPKKIAPNIPQNNTLCWYFADLKAEKIIVTDVVDT